MKYFKRIQLRGNELIKFLREKLAVSPDVIKEQLDCNISFSRKPTNKTIDEILDFIKISRHIHCSDKDGIICLIVGHEGVEYFLWITQLQQKD